MYETRYMRDGREITGSLFRNAFEAEQTLVNDHLSGNGTALRVVESATGRQAIGPEVIAARIDERDWEELSQGA